MRIEITWKDGSEESSLSINSDDSMEIDAWLNRRGIYLVDYRTLHTLLATGGKSSITISKD